jgi:transposase-like protein
LTLPGALVRGVPAGTAVPVPIGIDPGVRRVHQVQVVAAQGARLLEVLAAPHTELQETGAGE